MKLHIAIEDEQARQLLAHLASSLESRHLSRVIRRALVLHARTIRSAIRASSAPPRVKRAVARGVGTSVKARGRVITQAKVGIKVGKGNRRAPHAHWFVLGTADRYTARGLYRGRIRPMLKGVVRATQTQFSHNILEACRWYLNRLVRSVNTKGQ